MFVRNKGNLEKYEEQTSNREKCAFNSCFRTIDIWIPSGLFTTAN